MTPEELQAENARLRRRNEELEKENRWLRVDSSKRAFYALNRTINQQVDVLNDFNLTKEVMSGKKSEDATFERMQVLWKGIKTLSTDLNDMRDQLKIDGDAGEEEIMLPISPEMIAFQS
jgi:molecular chaperone GrpE (heat shock protein)